MTAGHLREARTSYTAEILLTATENAIGRRFQPELGIDIWELSQGR